MYAPYLSKKFVKRSIVPVVQPHSVSLHLPNNNHSNTGCLSGHQSLPSLALDQRVSSSPSRSPQRLPFSPILQHSESSPNTTTMNTTNNNYNNNNNSEKHNNLNNGSNVALRLSSPTRLIALRVLYTLLIPIAVAQYAHGFLPYVPEAPPDVYLPVGLPPYSPPYAFRSFLHPHLTGGPPEWSCLSGVSSSQFVVHLIIIGLLSWWLPQDVHFHPSLKKELLTPSKEGQATRRNRTADTGDRDDAGSTLSAGG
eukprot:GDKJ01030063.1.p1 GENE.GDKJ01030063.1~~GDKJ01030063.1.p1  ORF type:complete len:253 (+),score=65.66 GDKJ01030063.1:3-761(+)